MGTRPVQSMVAGSLVDCARAARTCAIGVETSKMGSSSRRKVFGVAVLHSAIASDLTVFLGSRHNVILVAFLDVPQVIGCHRTRLRASRQVFKRRPSGSAGRVAQHVTVISPSPACEVP